MVFELRRSKKRMRKRDKRNSQYGGIALMIVEVELGLEGDFP